MNHIIKTNPKFSHMVYVVEDNKNNFTVMGAVSLDLALQAYPNAKIKTEV